MDIRFQNHDGSVCATVSGGDAAVMQHLQSRYLRNTLATTAASVEEPLQMPTMNFDPVKPTPTYSGMAPVEPAAQQGEEAMPLPRPVVARN